MKIMISLSNSELAPLPRIISGFPGVGKSTLFKNSKTGIVDLDSSQFNKNHFPANYLEAIRIHLAAGNTVLVSAHQDVRTTLVDAGLPFVLVYPALFCRDEYIKRYTDRNSNPEFIKMMNERWVDFVVSCSEQKYCHHICLGKGKYLNSLESIAETLGMRVTAP